MKHLGHAKAELREKILSLRNSLRPDDVLRKSEQAVERFLTSSKILESKRIEGFIGLYRAHGNELNLSSLEEVLFQRNCSLAYPKIFEKNQMRFFHVKNPLEAKAWRRNPLGIEEPESSEHEVPMESLACLIIPAVVCDLSGNRIGMGKAYYDNYLSRAGAVKKISLVYDFQIVESFESEKHDIALDCLVSESRSLFLR